jgi:phosphoenolpyruvate carboxykinase (GTP)
MRALPEIDEAIDAPTRNPHLRRWVGEMARLLQPDRIVWCDGSLEEKGRLLAEALASKALLPLDQTKLPGCYYHHSNPNDVARVEQLTFICTPTKAEAGPTNNWMDPAEAYRKVGALFDGAMRGRTMYVVPYVMGPATSPFAKVGVELTDSVYVALSMRIMTRMGRVALDRLGRGGADFNKGVHAVRDCDPARRFICHFPQDDTIWSVGSGYGGNALLGKKCLALRIASYRARREGWLAEHMMILEAESPSGEVHYVAGAFPSACGKTNFAMMIPPAAFPGWKIRTVGDDIAWMHVGGDGRLWAVNPEFGYFGVAPGTSRRTNPNAMDAIRRDTLYTNVARTPGGDVWWEGMDGEPPAELIDWKGQPWKKGSPERAAHPNSRFTAPMQNNPALSARADDPAGVPISAIVFGGRRSTTVPLALEALDWTHGVYLGATLGSETTAAAAGAVGVVRRDPMAMLPFCGYDMGSYFGHWLSMGQRVAKQPKIFLVNWFRKGADGKFLWPGFGENMRVLKWMLDRCAGRASGQPTTLGIAPRPEELDLRGLEGVDVAGATRVDLAEWVGELESQAEWFEKLGSTLPPALEEQRQRLLQQARAALG